MSLAFRLLCWQLWERPPPKPPNFGSFVTVVEVPNLVEDEEIDHGSQNLIEHEGKYEALEKDGKDLTAMARERKLDPVIGRNHEIRRCIQIISRRTKNNPVLISELKVRKITISAGLTNKIMQGNCGLRIICKEQVIFSFFPQEYYFDCPYQLSSQAVCQTYLDAMVSYVKLMKGDTIVMGFDRLFDNVVDNVIVSKMVKFSVVIEAALQCIRGKFKNYMGGSLLVLNAPSFVPKNLVNFNVDNVWVAKLLGRSLHNSTIVRGMVLKSGVVGSIKKVEKARVAVFASGVDTFATATNTSGTILIHTTKQLENYAETKEVKIEELIKAVADLRAKEIFSEATVGEMALHFCECYKLMVSKINSKFELRPFCHTMGTVVILKLSQPNQDDLGYVDFVSVEEIGGSKVTVVRNEEEGDSIFTMLLLGITDGILVNLKRAIDDGVNTYKAMCDSHIIPRVAAPEIELVRKLKEFSFKETGLDQYAIAKFDLSFEIAPRILVENVGPNAGDCQVGLCHQGKAIVMSRDHKPICSKEKMCIEESSWYVYDGFLNGRLSMARALGDWHMGGRKAANWGPLSAEPEFKSTKLMEEDEFLIIASDRNLASGGAAGVSSLLFVYSLDHARTRLANNAKLTKTGGERQFNGWVDVYKKVIKFDGIVGLYRRFNISCVGIIVYCGLYCGMYDFLKTVVLTGNLQDSFLARFLLGWGLTIGAGLASYPIDTIPRRMKMTFREAVKCKSSRDAFS